MALVSLIVQVILLLGVIAGFLLARRRRLRRHCLLMRIVVGAEIVSIAVIMVATFVDYVRHPPPLRLLTTETIVHHSFGLAVVLIFIYIELVSGKIIKTRRGFKHSMWAATILWTATLLLGVHLYLRIY